MSKHGAYYIPTEKEYELFYSRSSQESRCLGHFRGYYDEDIFNAQFFEHNSAIPRREFAAEFKPLWEKLRKGALKSRSSAETCARCGSLLEDGYYVRWFGHKLETEHYEYYLRIPEPVRGNYVYIYCYVKEAN